MSHAPDSQDSNYQQAYRRARKQVRRLRGWYVHAFIFATIVGLAWLRYLFGGAFADWSGYHSVPRMPLGMTFGWGLGVLIHGLVVWGRFGPFGDQWEDRQIKRMMASQGDSKSLASTTSSGTDQTSGKW